MARIFYITQIEIDFGAVKLLPQECANAGIKRPLVVSDAGVRAAGVLGQALAALVEYRMRYSTRPRPTRPRPPCVLRWRFSIASVVMA